MRVIFVGESLEKSSPLLTWKNALNRVGVCAEVVDLEKISTFDWILALLKNDVVILQSFGYVGEYTLRQLAIASILFRPVIRKWSGTDVLKSVERSNLRKNTLSLDRVISLNLTSEHEGLVSELNSIGLDVDLTPQVLSVISRDNINHKDELPKKVLIYLPNTRWDFYAGSMMEKIIQANPSVEFVVLADEAHTLAKYSNVASLGWVEEMEDVWSNIGLLIRITAHDGYARSIVEALSRGKYVIHNNRISGCWFATNEREISVHLNHFSQVSKCNENGILSVLPSVNGKADSLLKKKLELTSVSWKRWWYSVIVVLRWSFKVRTIK